MGFNAKAVLDEPGRKKVARNRVAMVLSAGLVATLGGVVSGSAATAQAAQASRVPAASGGALVVGDTSSVQKLDPDIVTNFLDFQALGLVYDQLVQYNAQLQLVPDLATHWAYSDGNTLLTFQLRKGVTFDDGSTFTSANVVASLDRAIAPKTGDASASFLANVKKIVATGPYTVQFQLSTPDTSVLDGLTSVNLSMLSDQGHHRRHRGQDARRDRPVRVLELEPRQLASWSRPTPTTGAARSASAA